MPIHGRGGPMCPPVFPWYTKSAETGGHAGAPLRCNIRSSILKQYYIKKLPTGSFSFFSLWGVLLRTVGPSAIAFDGSHSAAIMQYFPVSRPFRADASDHPIV